jgi:hypothetical protein
MADTPTDSQLERMHGVIGKKRLYGTKNASYLEMKANI